MPTVEVFDTETGKARHVPPARRNADSKPLYIRVLGVFERAYGPRHPNVAVARSNYKRLTSIE